VVTTSLVYVPSGPRGAPFPASSLFAGPRQIIGILIPNIKGVAAVPYFPRKTGSIDNMRTAIPAILPPKQRRSQETLERLLDAAETVIRSDGIAGLTVMKVVSKALSSVGAFYRRFPDRDALIYAVQERNHARALELYADQLATLDMENAPIEETLEKLFSLRAAMILRDAPLVHAFAVQGALSPVFQDESRRFFASCRSTLTQVILAHRGEMAHPEPELAAEMVCRTWLALMEQLVFYGESPFDSPGRLSDAHVLVSEFCRASAAYLRGTRAVPLPD